MYIPGPQFGEIHSSRERPVNLLAIHFQNKTERKPVWNVTNAFRATELTLWTDWRTIPPFLVIDSMNTLSVFMNKARLMLVCFRSTLKEAADHSHTATQHSLGSLCLMPPPTWGYHPDLLKIWHTPVFTLLAFILSLLQVNCKWLFKVKNKTKHPSWPIPGYVYNTGQQKGMKGDLTGPLAMHVCAPFWPSPWRQWLYCLKRAGARDSPTGLYPKWPCRSLRFSRFWHTEFGIDLGPVTAMFMHWTHDHFCTCGLMITDTTAHPTGTTLPLSPVSRSKVPIHTDLHLSESPSQAKRKARCNMKHEYESASHDSDITVGNKARRQICSLSRYPRISNVHLLKLHLHSFWGIFFLEHAVHFSAWYQNED